MEGSLGRAAEVVNRKRHRERHSFAAGVESRMFQWQSRQVGEAAVGAGPTKARPHHVFRNAWTGDNGLIPARFTPRFAQVSRLVAMSLQTLGPAALMGRTRNQCCVPLTCPLHKPKPIIAVRETHGRVMGESPDTRRG